MVWSTNSGRRLKTFSIPCSSFRHGMITVMDLTFVHAGAGAGLALFYKESPSKSDELASGRIYGFAQSPARVVSVCAFGAANPELPNVKTVYMMQMSNGLDQYLANQLTKRGIFEVVTDPDIADAVFTDRIGTGFEQKWTELYPPPPPPKEEETKDTKETRSQRRTVVRPRKRWKTPSPRSCI